jgi:hypothetical protein
MTRSKNPSATTQDERHGGMKPFHLRSAIFLGMVFAAVVGHSGIALKLHTPAAVPAKEMQRQQTLSELRARAHPHLTAPVYDPHFTPEMRAAALAIRERVDPLFALDARLGINQAGIFLQQDSDRWERLIHAPAAAYDPQHLLTRRGGRSQLLSGRQVRDSGRSAHPLTCGETGALPRLLWTQARDGAAGDAASRVSTEFASHPARSISALSSSRGGS